MDRPPKFGRRALIGWLAAVGMAAGSVAVAQEPAPPTPFADVSPCHWATEAVARIAGEPQIDVEQARTSVVLAENALRQVLEGLRCNNLHWSALFMADTPAGVVPRGTLSSFTLEPRGTSLTGDTGVVAFALSAVIDGQTFTREGSVEVVFSGRVWKVRYASLAALELPVFP